MFLYWFTLIHLEKYGQDPTDNDVLQFSIVALDDENFPRRVLKSMPKKEDFMRLRIIRNILQTHYSSLLGSPLEASIKTEECKNVLAQEISRKVSKIEDSSRLISGSEHSLMRYFSYCVVARMLNAAQAKPDIKHLEEAFRLALGHLTPMYWLLVETKMNSVDFWVNLHDKYYGLAKT